MQRKKLYAVIVVALSAVIILPMILDVDLDGLPTWKELIVTHTNPFKKDTDGDGLSDGEEVKIGTNPLLNDTDGDGLSDGAEVHVYGTNPLVKDTDQDGVNDFQEVKLGTNPLNPDTDGDGLLDCEPFPLDRNRPVLDLNITSVGITRNDWLPQIDIKYDILGDNAIIDPNWIYNAGTVVNALNLHSLNITVNGRAVDFVPNLLEILIPVNITSENEVTAQNKNISIAKNFTAVPGIAEDEVSAYFAKNTMPVEPGPGDLEDAINSMQATFDDYAFVISGLDMMQRHVEDLKNMIGWDSDSWVNRLGSLGSNIDLSGPLQQVLTEFERIFVNSSKSYINDLESQVKKVWIDVQALKTFPWTYVTSYATGNSSIPTYLLDSMMNRILNPEDDLQWLDLFVGGGIDTLKGIYNQLCSDYYGWINGTSPIATIRYVADHAKWYINNIDHIRHVMTYDHTDGLLRGPVELVSWNGQLVVPWFSSGYTFDYIYNPKSAIGNPFDVENEILAEKTQLQYEPRLRLDYDLYPRGPQYYRACLATESKVQEYLQKYGFWLPHLPPTKTETIEFGKIRNDSKYVTIKLDSDYTYFLLGSDSLAKQLKTMANSYSDFTVIDQALSILREYKTSDNFMGILNEYLWHLKP